MQVLATFYAIRNLNGHYYKDDMWGWVPDLQSANLFSSVELLKDKRGLDWKQYRIVRYQVVSMGNIIFLKETIIE